MRVRFTQFAKKRWGIAVICTRVYTRSSSPFRNASSACSCSNTHFVVIVPIYFIGRARRPLLEYWGAGGDRPPCPPLPPPLQLTLVLTVAKMVHLHSLIRHKLHRETCHNKSNKEDYLVLDFTATAHPWSTGKLPFQHAQDTSLLQKYCNVYIVSPARSSHEKRGSDELNCCH